MLRWSQPGVEGCQGSQRGRSSTERRRDSASFGGARGSIGSGGRQRPCFDGCNPAPRGARVRSSTERRRDSRGALATSGPRGGVGRAKKMSSGNFRPRHLENFQSPESDRRRTPRDRGEVPARQEKLSSGNFPRAALRNICGRWRRPGWFGDGRGVDREQGQAAAVMRGGQSRDERRVDRDFSVARTAASHRVC